VILTVGPNPAIDRTAVVPRLALDAVIRPDRVIIQPGGKALNVARAARSLGAIVTTSGIVAGHAGHWLVEAAAAEGLDPRFVATDGETRTTYVVTDGRGRLLMVYEPSTPVPTVALDELVGLLSAELLPAASRVALAGSLPVGAGVDGFARLVEACHTAGRWCLLDTSGDGLLAGLLARPDVVKVTLDEGRGAGIAAGTARAIDVARALVERGAATAIVTDGERGAWASDGHSGWRVRVPRIATANPVGSGDAFTGGLLVAIEAGRGLEDALASAAAAGAANAETRAAGSVDPERHAQLLAEVSVERVAY
jgi:1-phosphofructokinase family hexose kinase